MLTSKTIRRITRTRNTHTHTHTHTHTLLPETHSSELVLLETHRQQARPRLLRSPCNLVPLLRSQPYLFVPLAVAPTRAAVPVDTLNEANSYPTPPSPHTAVPLNATKRSLVHPSLPPSLPPSLQSSMRNRGMPAAATPLPTPPLLHRNVYRRCPVKTHACATSPLHPPPHIPSAFLRVTYPRARCFFDAMLLHSQMPSHAPDTV